MATSTGHSDAPIASTSGSTSNPGSYQDNIGTMSTPPPISCQLTSVFSYPTSATQKWHPRHQFPFCILPHGLAMDSTYATILGRGVHA
eukprot:3578858-Amphidinium_carterae.2